MLLDVFVPLSTLPLAANLLVVAAEQPPHFDVRPSCRAAVSSGAVAGRTMENCEQSEQDALNQLKGQWTKFKPADRQRCIATSTMGAEPTYTELLSCLEMTLNSAPPQQPPPERRPQQPPQESQTGPKSQP
jgi:hypothetical protein